MRFVTISALALAALVLAIAAPDQGRASFPGRNGDIVYSGQAPTFQIFSMGPDGSNPVQLTDVEDGFERTPDWSPDGTRIAFASERDSDPDQVREIYVMNADGTGQTRLTFDESFNAGPAWSPDGQQIAYESRKDGPARIWVMNRDGSGQVNLSGEVNSRKNGGRSVGPAGGGGQDDGNPAWSPDGSRIVFDRSGDLYTMNSDGSAQIPLTTGPDTDQFANWSPDGTMIAFERDAQGVEAEIYVINVDGSGLNNLTNHEAADYEPAWSPDGNSIAFAATREVEGEYEIYVMDADGSNPVNITNSPKTDESSPAWLALNITGDADCDEDVDTVDSLQVLRKVGALSANNCVFAGNVKCDDALDAVDALFILRHVAALPVDIPGTCPQIGG